VLLRCAPSDRPRAGADRIDDRADARNAAAAISIAMAHRCVAGPATPDRTNHVGASDASHAASRGSAGAARGTNAASGGIAAAFGGMHATARGSGAASDAACAAFFATAAASGGVTAPFHGIDAAFFAIVAIPSSMRAAFFAVAAVRSGMHGAFSPSPRGKGPALARVSAATARCGPDRPRRVRRLDRCLPRQPIGHVRDDTRARRSSRRRPAQRRPCTPRIEPPPPAAAGMRVADGARGRLGSCVVLMRECSPPACRRRGRRSTPDIAGDSR